MITNNELAAHGCWHNVNQALRSIQGESKKTDTFDIQMNNKGVSFFLLTLYNRSIVGCILGMNTNKEQEQEYQCLTHAEGNIKPLMNFTTTYTQTKREKVPSSGELVVE